MMYPLASNSPSTISTSNTNDPHKFLKTAIEADFRVHKGTGEILGCFSYHDYTTEPFDYPAPTAVPVGSQYFIEEDGTPIDFLNIKEKPSVGVLPFPERPTGTPSSSNAGRKPAVTYNPLARLLDMLRDAEQPVGWMDDYIIGAAGIEVECEGSDTATTGRFNVAPSDVRKVLHLPEISTNAAAAILYNHEFKLMSPRQIERVVKAARIALGGMMRHLESHQQLLRQFEYDLSFDEFWLRHEKKNRGESPQQTEAIALHLQGLSITKIASRVGRHRNTVSRWIQDTKAA